MKRRLLIPITLVLLIFVCACSNRNKSKTGATKNNTVLDDSAFMTDSIDRPPFPGPGMEPSEMDERSLHHPYMEPPPPDDENRLHNDNMRGFDPASEDDMSDNGTSRYMENNDEEGWD